MSPSRYLSRAGRWPPSDAAVRRRPAVGGGGPWSPGVAARMPRVPVPSY
ncbi:hypothetical protein [Actinomadura meridiana]